MKTRWIRGLVVAGVAILLSLFFYYFHLFRPLEWKSWDLRLRLLANSFRSSKDIVLFLIDQESLNVYQQEQGLSWPWPRQIYSAVIRYCQQAQVKALVFDLIFSESSSYGVEDDEDFVRAMAAAGNVFLPVFLSSKDISSQKISYQYLKRFSLNKEKIPEEAIFSFRSFTLPVKEMLLAARGVGNVNFAPDDDGIYRRLPLFYSYNDLILPSLPLAVANYVKKELKTTTIPLDKSRRMIIRFYGPSGIYKSYSIASIINSYAQLAEGKTPQISPQEFKDKIILIGGSAPGLLDLRPSPFSAVNPGVEIIANALDNLLQQDFIRLPADIFILFLLTFLSLLTALGASHLQGFWKTSLFFILCLALPGLGAWLSFSLNYWLVFIAPEFVVAVSFIGASLLNYSFEGRQRRFLKNVFRHYLNPHVIEKIIANPSLLQLGGEKREITSFFSDIAGFTTIAESLTPEELVKFLNEYLSEMTDIILSFGGTLDKYEGDAIIAFWNAPLELPDHALRACRAALMCQQRLEVLGPDFEKRFGRRLSMRIGLNSGEAVVGNMGSQSRFDYTAMGDTVNLASRLEGACKFYHLPIIIGEEAAERVKANIICREVDLIQVVGKKRPVHIFEIIGEKGKVDSRVLAKIAAFEEALEAYRKGEWARALSLFSSIEDDALARIYIERCQQFKESGPPEGWAGIYQLKEK